MKRIYYGPDLRHKVKIRDGIIETVMERRIFLVFWKYIYGTVVHFKLRKDPKIVKYPEGHRIMPHINPSIMHYQNMGMNWHLYGCIESWDESTFDLKVRLYNIANEYIKSMQVQKTYASIAEKQIDEL